MVVLVQHVSYAADQDPSARLKDDGGKVLPPEGTELQTELDFFRQSYSSATIRSEKNEKIIDANSAPEEYVSSDLVLLLVFATLFAASVAAALLMLQKLFKVLAGCTSPFCVEFVSRLRTFGYSLLPVCGKGYCGFRPVGRIDYLCCNDVPCDGVPLRRSAPEGVRRDAVRRRCDGTYCIAA